MSGTVQASADNKKTHWNCECGVFNNIFGWVCETENLMQRPPVVHELHLPETHAHNLEYACKKQHSSKVLHLKIETAIFEGLRPTS